MHTQTSTLNVKLTFVIVWVEMPDVKTLDGNEQNYDWSLFLIFKRIHILPLK